MAKAGMKSYVSNHKDPTYDQALGNIRKQERAAATGYRIVNDLMIEKVRTGNEYIFHKVKEGGCR